MTVSPRPTSPTHPRTPPLRRAATLVATLALVVLPAGVAGAHHGFDDFDTGRLYYVSGTVSEVRWGEPHSFFTLTVDGDLPADTPELELPEELQSPEDRGPVDDAPSYPGSRDALEVVIAPPSYTGRWGLDRPLRDGETVEAVGYVGRSHDDEFRPVVFWFEGGTPVNQVLGSRLPARPLALPYPERGAESTDGAVDSGPGSVGGSPVAVWSVVGGLLVLLVLGSALVLRRSQSRHAASGGDDG